MDDAEIFRLISMPKRITEPPSKAWKEDAWQRRKDFCLEASDGQGQKFRAFARQSKIYPENFSIGLEYEPQDGQDAIILIRCNGPHGDFNAQTNTDHPHFHPHVHRASYSALSKGERAERYAERTNEFTNVKQAMRYFLETVGVEAEDQNRYFEEDLRKTLFEDIGEVE